MIQHKDSGIIIRGRDFFEADKILTILTGKRGKIRAIAKGIRKPTAKLAGNLELFSYSNLILIEGRNLEIVASAEIIESFKNIKKDLKKTSAAFIICELLDKLLNEKESQRRVFFQTLAAFHKLNSSEGLDLKLIIDYFMINILAILGYRPEIKKCQNCPKPITAKNNYFSIKHSSVVCPGCAAKEDFVVPISLENLKIIKLFLEHDIDVLDRIRPKNLSQLNLFLEMYIENISEKKLKSSKFFNMVNQRQE
ncbi:MAG TPA: DNA repair protein RecO [Patescibacteria group bacterium]|nr:DNA repair protein RecO [Patescibacteria group bacterium]